MRRNKILKKVGLGFIAPIAIAPIITSASGPLYKTGEIYFQGRKFKNEEEALKYLVQNKKIDIGTSKVLGNVNRSYINMESGLLNKELLPNYDVSKMHLAYNTAGGGLTPDYQRAKKTYFNKGMILKRYDDGYGGSFLSSHDASNSMRNKTIESKLMYTTVDYIAKDGSVLKKKINPFSAEDINNYKENIKNHIFDILAQNIEGKQDKAYDVKVLGQSIPNPTIEIDVPKQKPISGTANLNWKSKIFEIGVNLANDQIEGDWSDDFKFHASDFNKKGNFKWTNNGIKTFENNTNFQNFLTNKDKMIWISTRNDGGVKTVVNKFVDKESQNTKLKIKKDFSQQLFNDVKKSFIQKINNKPILKNQKLKNAFWKKRFSILDELKKIVRNESDQKILMSNPQATAKYFDDGWTHKPNRFQISITNITYDATPFLKKKGKKIEVASIWKDDLNKKIVKSLLSLEKNGEANFIITNKKNPNFSFDMNIKIDANGLITPNIKLITKKSNKNLITHTKNPKDILSVNPKLLIGKSSAGVSNSKIQKWFYLLLDNLYNELHQVNSKTLKGNSEIQKTFDKYFKYTDKYFGSVKNNLNFKYDADFVNQDPKKAENIPEEDAIKLYINIINSAYEKYKDYPKLLKKIASKIINPKDIFIPGINKLYLGQYVMKSIIDFNAPVSNGTFSSEEVLATNRTQWSVTKNNVDFNPALLIIVYDQNGERVNSDDYEYDNETILEFNSRLTAEPRRNFEWIFVDGHHGPVANITTTIQYVLVNDQKLYFRTFYQLKAFMINYIREHSIQI